jgi:hypothetical protein
MWATDRHPEHEGITGVTFDSDGHRLVGTCYLARGDEPKPTALLPHGCPGLEKNLDLAVTLRDRGWHRAGLRDLIADWPNETCN